MGYSFPLYSLVFFISGISLFALAIAVWSRRPAPGFVPLTFFLVVSGIWSAAAAFEVGALALSAKLFWVKIAYTGVVSSAVLWLCFTLDYSGSNWWKRPRNMALIGALPVIYLILAWTNDWHGWLWSDISLKTGPLGNSSVWNPGPLYFVNPVYQYILYLYGIGILLRLNHRRSRIYRKQVILLIIGTLIPIIGSVFYVLRITPATDFDLTPFYITIAAVFYSVTVFRFRFMDIVPVAYRTLIQNIPDGILVLDPEERIMEMNPVAAHLLKQNKPSLQNRPLADVWPELNHTVDSSPDGTHSTLTLGDASSSCYLDTSAVTLRDARQEPVGTLVVLRDISELKKAQQSLEALYTKEHELRSSLEEEIQKRNQYSRAVVHELRTPLTSIMACAELLEDEVKGNIQLTLVQNIRRSSINLQQRVNELFELARGEVGLLKIAPAPLDMAQLIREIASEMGPVASEKGITVRTDIPETSLPVMGDKGRLHQVLTNLIGNSLKFTHQGEIVIRARYPDSASLMVQVEDTGKGMDPEQMSNLFNPYRRQPKEGRSTTGLGIGLALSKIFVELHNGKIQAESTPGKGTTISFILPIKSYLVS